MYGLERCTPRRARRARTRLEEPERGGRRAPGRGRGRGASGAGLEPRDSPAGSSTGAAGVCSGPARPAVRLLRGAAAAAAAARAWLPRRARAGGGRAGPRLARGAPRADPGTPVRLRRAHGSDPGRSRSPSGRRRPSTGNAEGGHPDSSGCPPPRAVRRRAADAGQTVIRASSGAPCERRLQAGCGPPRKPSSIRTATPGDLGARPADELERRLGGAAGGEDVVDDQDPVTGGQVLGVDLDLGGAVLQLVRLAERRSGELARPCVRG